MDTSETYVKMCEKALKDIGNPKRSMIDNELQMVDRLTLWARRYPDGIYFTWIAEKTFDDAIPVYAQDQLWEIFDNTKGLLSGEVQLIYEYMRSFLGHNNWPETWEQLLLRFVMKEKYGKIWNGEDWDKSDKFVKVK
jgi:hypothetical protein